MSNVLSIWRSPLDKVAFREAEALCDRQPLCSISYGEDFSPVTIYNYGYYVTNATGHNPNTALTNMLSAMSSPSSLPYGTTGVGGTAFIPQGGFAVTSSSSGFAVPDQCNIVASGGGGRSDGGGAASFYHFVVSPPTLATAPTYFFYCSGTHTSGGQYFRGLAFNWGTTTFQDVCIYANTWNCSAIDCTFTDCPVAFNAQGLSCGLEESTVQFTPGYAGPAGGGPTGANAFSVVVLAGSQCYAVGPAEYLQPSQSGTGPADMCCISFQNNLEHGVVRDLHINHWSFGITYGINSGKVNHCMVTNVEFSTYGSATFGDGTCVHMQPAGSAGTIYDQKYTSCSFSLGDSSINTNSLVFIDTNGGSKDNVNDIQFIGCTASQGKGHGYEIKVGSNIQIVGGTSSGNGPAAGAGIAITGNSGRCTFVGVTLNASYPNANVVQSQKYAFLCSGSPTDEVILDKCPMSGYSGSPVSISGSPTKLYITNCLGYNDQNTTIASGTGHVPSTPTSASDASSLGGASINYYGPSLVIFTNGGSANTFTINGIGSTVPANAFVVYAVASPYDTIEFSGALASFHWVGK